MSRRATGRRFLAALCFLVGGLTLVLIPVLWPLGYVFYRDARAAEKAANGGGAAA